MEGGIGQAFVKHHPGKKNFPRLHHHTNGPESFSSTTLLYYQLYLYEMWVHNREAYSK